MCGEPALVHAFEHHEDVHTATARLMFATDEPTKQQRGYAKMLNYAVLYGVTDLPIMNIGYPNTGYHSGGKGVLLGAYIWGRDAMEFTAMTPEERVKKVVEYGGQIHPQYHQEFENGVAVAWHRSPFTMGCFGMWSNEARIKHYAALCQIDERIVLAGEHASYLSGWQEGAVTSSLDAVGRLHLRAVAQGAKT